MWRAEVQYRPDAIADLQLIFDSIAEATGSHIVARSFVDRIMQRCSKIGDAPYGGRPRDDLQKGLRTIPFERTALIAYRLSDVVEITNVFYGGRDFEALYRPNEDTS